jgi:hypothetical protein
LGHADSAHRSPGRPGTARLFAFFALTARFSLGPSTTGLRRASRGHYQKLEAWRRTQSKSNPSPTREFPANREINREFRQIRLVDAILKTDTRVNSEPCSEIPYSTEQGIFAKEQGICTQRTGNFSRQVTIIRRPRFLIGRFYKPCPPPAQACHRYRPEPQTIVPTRDKVGPARFFADIFVPFDAQAAISRRFG